MVTIKDDSSKYVASLDVGTTSVRCIIYDQNTRIVSSSAKQVELLYPQPGFVEIDPEQLWEAIVSVIREAVKESGLDASQISCLGISTQRSSFTIWNSETGKPFFNIITWRDLRADQMVRKCNNSFRLKAFHCAAKMVYYLTWNKRYLTGSALKMMNTQVTMRLLWTIQNIPEIKENIEKNNAKFGTLDTWVVYRLTNRKIHATDYSNAACTGFFDPFTMQWADWAKILFNVPQNILPIVLDTAGDFGSVHESVLGHPIPIRSLVADQSASMFGSCSFNVGDLKLTLGTGSFITVNTGDAPHSSIAGIYPLIGWHINGKTTYVAEGASSDTGTLVKWAQNIGLIDDPAESAAAATSVKDTDGVFFIPSFSGIQAPVNDGTAATGFIGIKPTTSKNHVVRSILESIVFRIGQLYQLLRNETNYTYEKIKIDGGVAQNNFIAQLLSDVTMLEVERATTIEMSALGAAYLAGLASGVWNTEEELKGLRMIDKTFKPRVQAKRDCEDQMYIWETAMKRFLHWYDMEVGEES